MYEVRLDISVIGSNGKPADAGSFLGTHARGYQASTMQFHAQGNTLAETAHVLAQGMGIIKKDFEGTGHFPVLVGTYLCGEQPVVDHPMHHLLAGVYGKEMGEYKSLLLNARFTFPLHQGTSDNRTERDAVKSLQEAQLNAGISLVPLYTAFLGSSPAGELRDQRADYVARAKTGHDLTRYHLVSSIDSQKQMMKYQSTKFRAAAMEYVAKLQKKDRSTADRLRTALKHFDALQIALNPWTITHHNNVPHLVFNADSCPDLEAVIGMMALTEGVLRTVKLTGESPVSSKPLKSMELYARYYGLENRQENHGLLSFADSVLDFAATGLSEHEQALLMPLASRLASGRNPADDIRDVFAQGGYAAIHSNIIIPSIEKTRTATKEVAVYTLQPEPVASTRQKRAWTVPARLAEVAAATTGFLISLAK